MQKLRRLDHTQSILSLLKDSHSSKNLEKYLSPVTAVTISEAIDFDLLQIPYEIIVPDEVVNVKFESKDLMILSNGTLVGWDLAEEEILKIVPSVKNAVVEECEYESDEVDWVEVNIEENLLNGGNSYLQGEIMVIQGLTTEKKMLDKATFALGLSRSTRLAVLENTFEKHLQITKFNSDYLLKGLKIKTSEAEFLKLTGRLFLLRGKLNLHSELIETPDLYWSEPTLEKIYDSVSKILDINSRIAILNRKLDYATDEQRAFLGVLNEKKGTRLEWIIIYLIMVEVCFESFHFYERYMSVDVKLKALEQGHFSNP